ncbi:hypothetical protein C0992_007236 [Termitomyces sp. T32_za158]|nr:hypothetical protein C0992_007236 [Termitomyces sp. T32_za158]
MTTKAKAAQEDIESTPPRVRKVQIVHPKKDLGVVDSLVLNTNLFPLVLNLTTLSSIFSSKTAQVDSQSISQNLFADIEAKDVGCAEDINETNTADGVSNSNGKGDVWPQTNMYGISSVYKSKTRPSKYKPVDDKSVSSDSVPGDKYEFAIVCMPALILLVDESSKFLDSDIGQQNQSDGSKCDDLCDPDELVMETAVMQTAIQDSLMIDSYVGFPELKRLFTIEPYGYDRRMSTGQNCHARVSAIAEVMSKDNVQYVTIYCL